MLLSFSIKNADILQQFIEINFKNIVERVVHLGNKTKSPLISLLGEKRANIRFLFDSKVILLDWNESGTKEIVK